MSVYGEIYVLSNTWRRCLTMFTITSPPYIFGSKNAEVLIERFGVAEKHAKLSVDEEGDVILANLCKENPTILNGAELKKKAVLNDGDIFVIGYRVFLYRDAAFAEKHSYNGAFSMIPEDVFPPELGDSEMDLATVKHRVFELENTVKSLQTQLLRTQSQLETNGSHLEKAVKENADLKKRLETAEKKAEMAKTENETDTLSLFDDILGSLPELDAADGQVKETKKSTVKEEKKETSAYTPVPMSAQETELVRRNMGFARKIIGEHCAAGAILKKRARLAPRDCTLRACHTFLLRNSGAARILRLAGTTNAVPEPPPDPMAMY